MFLFCFFFQKNFLFNYRGISPIDLCKIHSKISSQLLKYQLHISIHEGHQNPRSMRICLSNCVSGRTPCFTWIWNSHNRHLSLQLKGWLCWRSYPKLNYKDILGEGEFSFSTIFSFNVGPIIKQSHKNEVWYRDVKVNTFEYLGCYISPQAKRMQNRPFPLF